MFWALGAPWGSQGCASRGRNPKGPQNTPFCHQSGRRPTIFDIRTGILRRISAPISPGGSHPLNLMFFVDHFWHAFLGEVDFWPEKNAPARQRRPVATGLGDPSPWGGGGSGSPLGIPRVC